MTDADYDRVLKAASQLERALVLCDWSRARRLARIIDDGCATMQRCERVRRKFDRRQLSFKLSHEEGPIG